MVRNLRNVTMCYENIRNDMGMNEEELQEMREADVDDETLHALSLAGRVEWKKRILYYANLLNSEMKKILDDFFKKS